MYGMRQEVIVRETANALPEHFQAGSRTVYALPAVMEEVQYSCSSIAPYRRQEVSSGSEGMSDCLLHC